MNKLIVNFLAVLAATLFSTAVAQEPESTTTDFEFAVTEYHAHFDESFTPELVFNTDTYKKSDINFSTTNTDIILISKTAGSVNVKRVEGECLIRAYVKSDESIYAEMKLYSSLVNPVTSIVLGDGTPEIVLSYMDIYALCPTVEPEDADVKSYDIEISDPEIATTYSVRAFNPSRSFFELVTHKPGEVDVTFKAQDGSGTEATYHFIVEEPDRTPATDSWLDGTFWLNEDWFGHTNGSINYIDSEGNIRYRVYESQNPYESFGCTSQYGMIFGDKLYVMSKQATDKGDTRRGGGRLVVADARTLEKLAGFDDLLSVTAAHVWE